MLTRSGLVAVTLASLCQVRAEQGLAVVAAEQEGEPVQVLAQLSGAVGRVAGEGFQRGAEPVRVVTTCSAAIDQGFLGNAARAAAMAVSGWRTCKMPSDSMKCAPRLSAAQNTIGSQCAASLATSASGWPAR